MKYFASIIFVCISQLHYAQGFAEIGSILGVDAGYYSGEYGGGISFADFNQDGLDDLTFATGTGQDIHFFQNNGNGFTALESLVNNTSEVKQVLWVDYDNDGDLDLYATAHNGNKLYKNNGDLVFSDITSTCGFSDPPSGQSFCASWLDYDHDALPDLIVSFRIQHLVGKIMLYHNLGNDQFEDVTNEAGMQNLGNSVLAMATLDFNNDGWEDIYVGQDYQAGCILLKNNGDGTFDNISASSYTNIANNTMTVTIGDYNGDALMDIYLTDTGAGNSLLRNLGNETFADEAYSESVIMNQFSWGAAFIDVENDMDVDLHINRTNGCTMYGNIPDAPFANITSDMGFSTNYYYSVGLATGDYNNDGLVDLVKNGSNGSPSSFWMNNNTGNNYITIDLHSTVSNTMAIGAVIDVFAGGKHQLRRVGCGEGFSSQNSYSQFFGLGTNTFIDEIIVHWPNGLITSTYNIEANQRIDLFEVQPVAGCTDETSCNFNPEATDDDGTCIFAELYYTCDGECISDSNSNGVCDELEVYGCMEETACNYDSEVTFDNGSCEYAPTYYNCEGYCLNDNDNDGICNELEIAGCTNIDACNYDSTATDDDGSCAFIEANSITGDEGVEVGYPYSYTCTNTIGSTYQWNVEMGSVTSGQGSSAVEIIFDTEGIHQVSVVETNVADCAGPMAVLNVNAVIGSVSSSELASFNIFPNPASDLITIQSSHTLQIVQLFNAQGQLIREEKINSNSGVLEIKTLASGMYFVKVDGAVKIMAVK